MNYATPTETAALRRGLQAFLRKHSLSVPEAERILRTPDLQAFLDGKDDDLTTDSLETIAGRIVTAHLAFIHRQAFSPLP